MLYFVSSRVFFSFIDVLVSYVQVPQMVFFFMIPYSFHLCFTVIFKFLVAWRKRRWRMQSGTSQQVLAECSWIELLGSLDIVTTDCDIWTVVPWCHAKHLMYWWVSNCWLSSTWSHQSLMRLDKRLQNDQEDSSTYITLHFRIMMIRIDTILQTY